MIKIAGMVLIIIGVVALIYGGFTYSSDKTVMSMGGMQLKVTENHTLPISPILGVVAIAGGAGLLYFKVRKGY